jgi:hypothetical protein
MIFGLAFPQIFSPIRYRVDSSILANTILGLEAPGKYEK